MSRPIKLTEELKQNVIEEFAAALDSIKMADGKINYSKAFQYKGGEKATITFTPEAYDKMMALVISFESEVAWHGVGCRTEGANFLITDILVYPQTVTGTQVEMDTDEYAKWLMSDDDRLNHIVMQGHSHVNMSTTPSSVDLTHQDDILSQLTPDMFYIFVIWNKKNESTIKIYDLANNTLYEDNDIEYVVADEDKSIGYFLTESKEQVKRKAITYSGYSGGNKSSYASSKSNSKVTGFTSSSDDDDDDCYGDYYSGYSSYHGGYCGGSSSSYTHSGNYGKSTTGKTKGASKAKK